MPIFLLTTTNVHSINATLFLIMFYLPIYFQSIHGQSAITSGVNTLPFLAFFALGALTSGVVVGKTRLLQPYQLLSAVLMTVGSALFYTLEFRSSKARYIGPQIIFGFGLGLGSQVPVTAVQAFSAHEDVPSATGIMISKFTPAICYGKSLLRLSVSSRRWRIFFDSSPIYVCQSFAADTQNGLSRYRCFSSP